MKTRRSPGVSVGVRFTAAGDDLYGPKATDGRDPLAGVRSMLDPEITKAMVEAEPRLLAWLRASRDNVVQFTMDPMNALRAALPDFDPGLLERIGSIRTSAQRARVDLPGVRVDQFTVEVEPAEKGKK